MSKNPEIRFKDDVNDWNAVKLNILESEGKVKLSRGNIISKEDILNCPGDYPIYSSSAKGDGSIGTYGKYMFDDERISWSIDGGGKFFYRGGGKYSITNVCGHMKVLDENINTQFLYQNLYKQWQEKHFDYQFKAHPSVIGKEYEPALPNKKVQNEIASLLSSFDKKIELEEEAVVHLQNVKASMLQKMFPRDGQKVPEIRFAGFTDDWEQRKCGDMTVELSEYDNLQSGYPLLTSSRSGLMFQNDFRDKTSTDNQETLFSVVPYGKCTYRHMSDDNIFHFNINTITEKGLVSREYPVFDANENNNLSFLIQYLNSSPEFTKFCAERKLGGTRTRLYYKNLCEFILYAPNKNEQDKIAEYFANLDNLITLHQRKCDKLKDIKKALLDKMLV